MLKKIIRWITKRKAAPTPQMDAATLGKMLNMTREEEYSCDDVYAVLDQYVEHIQNGEDAQRLMPLVAHHLAMCPDCREEMEALLATLQAKEEQAPKK